MTDTGDRVTTVNVLTTTKDRQNEVVAAVEHGVRTILSQSEGFITNRIYRSTNGDAVLNMTEWTCLEVVKTNHEKNEQNPEFKRQMAAVEPIAKSAPNAYKRVGVAIDRDAILAVERALIDAVLTKDRAGAEAVLADEFTATGHAGNFVDRKTYLDIHFTAEREFTEFTTRDQVLVQVADAVLVCGWTSITSAAASRSFGPKRYTALYAPTSGGVWKILYWQETPIVDANTP